MENHVAPKGCASPKTATGTVVPSDMEPYVQCYLLFMEPNRPSIPEFRIPTVAN